MKSIVRATFLIIAVLTLCSCAQGLHKAGDDSNPDYGPSPSDHEAIVKEWIRANLRDPYSVQDLQISHPVADRYWGGLLVSGGHVYAYRVCVRMNAKNAFGAYTGLKEHVFWIKYSQILGVTEKRC